jgi:YHS domain-containing protein
MSVRILFAMGILVAGFLYTSVASAATTAQFRPISSPQVEGKNEETTAAFAGFDVVERYPSGVNSRRLGGLVLGDPTFASEHKGTVFWFANDANRKAFDENPNWYMPPVGGYCLGALSNGNGRLVPGYLENTFFVQELQTWAVFGSARGPKNWRKKTPGKSRISFKNALKNYHNWTSQ